MAKSKKKAADPTGNVTSYTHDAKRKNNPPAGLASEGQVPTVAKQEYAYSPRRVPELRFDVTGESDLVSKSIEDLLKIVQTRPLTADEARQLETTLRAEPWLEWAGKR